MFKTLTGHQCKREVGLHSMPSSVGLRKDPCTRHAETVTLPYRRVTHSYRNGDEVSLGAFLRLAYPDSGSSRQQWGGIGILTTTLRDTYKFTAITKMQLSMLKFSIKTETSSQYVYKGRLPPTI